MYLILSLNNVFKFNIPNMNVILSKIESLQYQLLQLKHDKEENVKSAFAFNKQILSILEDSNDIPTIAKQLGLNQAYVDGKIHDNNLRIASLSNGINMYSDRIIHIEPIIQQRQHQLNELVTLYGQLTQKKAAPRGWWAGMPMPQK